MVWWQVWLNRKHTNQNGFNQPRDHFEQTQRSLHLIGMPSTSSLNLSQLHLSRVRVARLEPGHRPLHDARGQLLFNHNKVSSLIKLHWSNILTAYIKVIYVLAAQIVALQRKSSTKMCYDIENLPKSIKLLPGKFKIMPNTK